MTFNLGVLMQNVTSLSVLMLNILKLSIIMPNVIQSVGISSVILQSVIMPNAVAPNHRLIWVFKLKTFLKFAQSGSEPGVLLSFHFIVSNL